MVEEHNGTHVENVRCRRESQIKDGRQKPEVKMKQRNISASIQDIDINEVPKVTPTFLGCRNTIELVFTLSDIGVSSKSQMSSITRSTYEITQNLSFYTR